MLSVLSALVLAATPVKAADLSFEGSRLALTVRLPAPPALESVRTGLDEKGRLWMRVPGATSRVRTFTRGMAPVRANPRPGELLLIASPARVWGCKRPVTLELLPGALRSSVECDSPPATARARPALARPNGGALPAPPAEEAFVRPSVAQSLAERAPSAQTGAPLWPDALASPAPSSGAGTAAPGQPQAASVPQDPGLAATARGRSAGGPAPLSEGTPAGPAPGEEPLFATPTASSDPSGARLGGTAVLALLLLAGGGAVLLVARRRPRAARGITILETAAVGPKRSLVLARVGSEVLLLGSGEGGLTLLKTLSEADAVALRECEPSPARARRGPSFAEHFTESLEDLELRQKLQQGLAGRVA